MEESNHAKQPQTEQPDFSNFWVPKTPSNPFEYNFMQQQNFTDFQTLYMPKANLHNWETQISPQLDQHQINLNQSPSFCNTPITPTALFDQGQQLNPSSSCQDQNLDFGGLSCTQILGLATGGSSIGLEIPQYPQLDSNTSLKDQNIHGATQTDAEKLQTGTSKGMDNGSSTPPQLKRKKGLDMNKKPTGEKRQQKFYWPKIDAKKKPTPKPKTPKQVTPKQKKYVKKKDATVSKAPEQVFEETTRNSSCKRVLNFKGDELASLNLESVSTQPPEVPVSVNPKPKRKYVRKKNVALKSAVEPTTNLTRKEGFTVEEGNIASLGSNSELNSVVHEPSTQKKPVEIQALNLEMCKYTSLSDLNLSLTRDEEKPISCVTVEFPELGKRSVNKLTQKNLRVFRRKLGSKCLVTCRQKGLNFQESSKKRRTVRRKRSFEALKQLEGFNNFGVLPDLLDRITIMRGKMKMLMPMKANNVQESFKCVLSLLCPSMKLRKKKRSTKQFVRTNHIAKETIIDNGERSCLIPVPLCSLPIMDQSSNHGIGADIGIGEQQAIEMQLDTKQCNTQCQVQLDTKPCNTEYQGKQTSPQDASLSIYNVKDALPRQESRTTPTKRKQGRPSKSKGKRATDYLSGLSDWCDKSVEQIMDPFIKQFESMELYDNPKALERWSVLNSGEESKADGMGETNEKIKIEEERVSLLEKINRFLSAMTWSQGPRDFVKWNGSVLDSVVGVFLTQNVSDVLSSNAYMELGSRYPLETSSNRNGVDSGINSSQGSSSSTDRNVVIEYPEEEETSREEVTKSQEFDDALHEMLELFSDLKTSKAKGKQAEQREKIDWEAIRVKFSGEGQSQRNPGTQDSVDWDAVRNAPVQDIAKAIHGRGQNNIIAAKIKKTLNRIVEQHKSLDLEWLRQAPPQVAKAYLLSFYGLGLKSVECLRLLTLHHHGFPVDVNIGRISIRLGWVPLKPLPMGLPFHLLEKYPLENEIQQYLWPKLCHLDQKTLYKLHYQMITFGKVFCMKKNPNCGACPFKGECKYYASLVTSKFALPRAQERRVIKSKRALKRRMVNPFDIKRRSPSQCLSLPASNANSQLQISRSYHTLPKNCEPIVEMPSSPEPEVVEAKVTDIEDLFNEGSEEIPLIRLSNESTSRNYFQENIPFQNNLDLSRALVSLSPKDACLPPPKHMINIRLRTEHQVYELPDHHPLLKDLDRRDEKDPLPYLLAIWPPGCESGNENSCSNENTQEDEVPGTLLIPSRTAMRGSFALNGTYFQVNEVFADDESSQCPISVPRVLLWNLPRRTLYCGSSTTSIFRGLTWNEIQHCCCQGFICTRGFNRKTRAPKHLPLRFHNRLKGGKLQPFEEEEED